MAADSSPLQLFKDSQGRWDEQPCLMILFGLVLAGLEIFSVVVRGDRFAPLEFAGTCAAFSGGSISALTLRSRYSAPPAGEGDANASVPH